MKETVCHRRRMVSSFVLKARAVAGNCGFPRARTRARAFERDFCDF
jgi:hypothetical protein